MLSYTAAITMTDELLARVALPPRRRSQYPTNRFRTRIARKNARIAFLEIHRLSLRTRVAVFFQDTEEEFAATICKISFADYQLMLRQGRLWHTYSPKALNTGPFVEFPLASV